MKNLLIIKKDISANFLKYLALITMFFDHFFVGFINHNNIYIPFLRIPGRIAAPIMCYFIAEGFFYTSNLRKYICRMLAFSIISHFAYVLYFGLNWFKATSVFWGLTLGLLALVVLKNEKITLWIKIILIGFFCLLSVPANWNYISVLWIINFGLFRNNFKYQMLGFAFISIFILGIPTVMKTHLPHSYQFAVLFAIPLLAMYKGRRGEKTNINKWIFYLFYPFHLFFLYGMKILFCGH